MPCNFNHIKSSIVAHFKAQNAPHEKASAFLQTNWAQLGYIFSLTQKHLQHNPMLTEITHTSKAEKSEYFSLEEDSACSSINNPPLNQAS